VQVGIEVTTHKSEQQHKWKQAQKEKNNSTYKLQTLQNKVKNQN
jgi:hypothetical protein